MAVSPSCNSGGDFHGRSQTRGTQIERLLCYRIRFPFFFFKPFFKKKKKVVERLSGSSASPLEFRVFHGNYKTAVMENW